MLGKSKYNNNVEILYRMLTKGKIQLYLIDKTSVSKNYIFKHFRELKFI